MTRKQYARWKSFSVRMARHGFPEYRKANREKIEGYVRDFFWIRFDDDKKEIASVRNWDSGPAYVCDYARDFVFEHLSEATRNPGEKTQEFIESATHKEFGETYKGWEGEDKEDFWRYRRKEAWGNLVSCCVRAGLDVACAPSAGVLGFTLGDLRRMYPEGMPQWVMEFFEKPEEVAALPDAMGVWL